MLLLALPPSLVLVPRCFGKEKDRLFCFHYNHRTKRAQKPSPDEATYDLHGAEADTQGKRGLILLAPPPSRAVIAALSTLTRPDCFSNHFMGQTAVVHPPLVRLLKQHGQDRRRKDDERLPASA